MSLSNIRLPLTLHALHWPSAELFGVLDRRELLRVELLQEEVGCLRISERVVRLVEDGGRKVGSRCSGVGGGESGEVRSGAEGVWVGRGGSSL